MKNWIKNSALYGSGAAPGRVVYIGDYPLDNQVSMGHYVRWLSRAMENRGIVTEVIRPSVQLNRGLRRRRADRGARKWLGYIDKFVLYPRFLRRWHACFGDARTLYHVVDHSNAFYASALPRARTVVTCHDVLAIRGGLGDAEAYCPASPTGRILQRWILSHLRRAEHVVCVSESTRRDLVELGGGSNGQTLRTIHNGVDHSFRPLMRHDAQPLLDAVGLADRPFFLHVGSSLPRKNRERILDAFAKVAPHWSDVALVFVGKALTEPQQMSVLQLGLNGRVVELGHVHPLTLVALYSKALGLVFPSVAEGFGWPVIEAQACGCPVITSDRSALVEVAGEGALLCPPFDAVAIADAMLRLRCETTRAEWRRRGFANRERFLSTTSEELYYQLYVEMSSER